MAAYANDGNMAMQIADLARRVKDLESAPQLGTSSIRGGSLAVLDGSGEPIALLGNVPNSAGAQDATGFLVVDPVSGQATIWANDDDGLLCPQQGAAWHIITERFDSVSATFETAFEARFEQVACPWVKTTVILSADATTPGEARLIHVQSGAVTNTKSIPAGSNALYTAYWTHGAAVHTGPATIQLQIRRVSGAGQVHAYTPSDVTFGNWRAFATTGGW